MPEPCLYAIVSVSILDQYICFWVSSLPGLFVGLLQSGVTSGHLSTSMQSSQPRHTAGAKATARLLGCCGFLLPTQLYFLKQFALPKANFGWVARGPTWTVASSLCSLGYLLGLNSPCPVLQSVAACSFLGR